MDQTFDPKLALADKKLYADLWADARMTEVVEYLRGAKNLALPEDWQHLFPTSLPPP